jgi:hypothetical protein
VQPIFPDMFHIHTSMDECWINEMYMYVCMYVCMYVSFVRVKCTQDNWTYIYDYS